MQDYNFIIKHIPGESNKSDALSRRPDYNKGEEAIITTHTHASSSSLMQPGILFNDNALSQQERGLTRDPDDPDDTDAWMWSFDDEDASRDATKKVRRKSIFFFPFT